MKPNSRWSLIASLLLAAALLTMQVYCSDGLAPGVDLTGDGGGAGAQKCSNSAQCKPGFACVKNTCQASKDGGSGGGTCSSKVDCDPGFDCVGGKCTESGGGDGGGKDGGGGGDTTEFDGGKACSVDGDCGTGMRCDKGTGTCIDLLRPSIETDPLTLDFGAVHYGECPAKDLTITNAGGADLQILGIDFGTGTNPDPGHPRFTKTVSQNVPATIKPAEYMTVSVTYCQDDAQADTGELQITSTDAKKPNAKVPLVSSYKGDPSLAIVDRATTPPDVLWPKPGISQYTVDLGNTDPGLSVTKDVAIMNAAAGDAILSITGPVISKISNSQNEFSFVIKDPVAGDKELTPPVYLNPGDIVVVTATYTCTEMNFDDKANLTLPTNDADINDDGKADDGKAILFLKAKCGYVGPKIEVSRTTVDFGDVQKAGTKTEKVTIANSGKDNLIISQAKLQTAATDFGFNPDPFPSVIAPAGSVELSFTFAPKDIGAAANVFLITSNDGFGNVDVKIDLKARGTDPTITVNPTAIDFGPVFGGFTAGPNKVTIKAGGYGPLSIASIGFTAGSSTDFKLGTLPPFPVVLNTNDQLEFDVTFQPTDFTDRSAGISIKNSDNKSGGEVVVTLAGKGVNCCATRIHATGVCNGATCTYTCDPSYWDNNGDLNGAVSNGCEYGPCTKSNNGVEICDGLDNDCNGTPDDGAIDQICPPTDPVSHDHAVYQCDSAAKTCKVKSCDASWYNVDGTVGNGCECQQDNYDVTAVGNSCAGAVSLGNIPDTSPRTTVTATGNVVGQSDDDWYKFTATDNATQDDTAAGDNWHVRVQLTTNPSNAFQIMVFEGDCSVPTETCLTPGETVFEKTTDLYDAPSKTGEAGCRSVGTSTGTTQAGSLPGTNVCSDDTRTYFVRVSRASGAPFTCDYYVLTVSNGK